MFLNSLQTTYPLCACTGAQPLPSYPPLQTHTPKLLSLLFYMLAAGVLHVLHAKTWAEGAASDGNVWFSWQRGKDTWQNYRWHLKLLLEASIMSLLLLFLWPKEVTWPNLMSVGTGSKHLPQKSISSPIATSSYI